VGPSITQNQGIIGESVDMNLVHTGDLRRSTLIMNLTVRLLETKYRDTNGDIERHLYGPLRAITRQWLDGYLVCTGKTYPAQLMYQALSDMACNRIHQAITRHFVDEHPIRVLLDPYNPTGSTAFVNFNTSKKTRWETRPDRCHINWVIYDSDWEAEFCRAAESHPRVKAYVKNHSLGFEVPYQYMSESRRYRPDFIVLVDDGRGEDDLLHLVVEIKGYRRQDAREKAGTMDAYWVPGVNRLGSYGRWAFAEFRDVWEIESDLEEECERRFNEIVDDATEVAKTESKEHTP